MTFAFRLEQRDGTPPDPADNERAGSELASDTIALGRDRALRVVELRQDDPDADPCSSWRTRVERTCPG